MNIYTIMDYTDHQYIQMSKIWLYFAKRFNPKAKINIFYQREKAIKKIKKFANYFNKISFKKLDTTRILKLENTLGKIHPSQELKLALIENIEYQKNKKSFIYIDSDAFILDSLDQWWSIIKEKPLICIAERYYQSKKLFNLGVFSYCPETKFLNYQSLKQLYKEKNKIELPSSDQGLINELFRKNNYYPDHPKIGHEYNLLAINCKTEIINDKKIIVLAGNISKLDLLITKFFPKEKKWWKQWLGWNYSKKAKILHAVGPKFWQLAECKKIWQYGLNKINQLSNTK